MAAAKKRSSARRTTTCRMCGQRTGPLARSAHPELCVQCFVEARQGRARSGFREASMWALHDKIEGEVLGTKKKTTKKKVAKKPKPKPKPTGPQTRFDREDVI